MAADRDAELLVLRKDTLAHIKAGLALLGGESCWEKNYDLALALHVEAVEAACLTGDYDYMEDMARIVLQQALTLPDKLPVYEIKIQACIARHNPLEAIDMGLSVLSLLDLTLPPKVSKVDILFGLAETKLALAGKGVEDLRHLPEMTD